VLVLALSLSIGAFTGIVSAGLGLHPLIVTLGVGYLIQGGVQRWTGGTPSGSAPGWMGNFVSPGATTGPIPFAPIVLLWFVVGIAIILVLRYTVFGRRLYAVGSNPQAARLALVNPIKIWTLTFALSAGCAALAGLLLLGFSGSAFAGVGDPYLFLSVGAVVIGGTSLVGGRGGYAGTMAGAIILTELTTILTGFNYSGAQEQVFLGAIIVLMVLVYGRESHVRMRI
jgi:ribose transport system permease protein